jgi:hypothetical protein
MASDALLRELNRMKLDELRVLSRELGLRGVSSASKAELVQQLTRVDDATLEGTLRLIGAPAGTLPYHAALWEKITTVAVAVWIVGLVSFLAIQNEPLADGLAQFVRILLSLAVSVIGATVPGFLAVGLSTRGLVVRAGGALALFVLTYFFAPEVLSSVQPSTVFTIKDVATQELVDRTFDLEYRFDGQPEFERGSNGSCNVPARRADDVEVVAVSCKGYAFERKENGILWLSRIDDQEEGGFLDSIEPVNPYKERDVSPADYSAAIARGVPPREVEFKVVNHTRNYLDVLLYRYTQGQGDELDVDGWKLLPRCQPNGGTVIDGAFGKPGGWFFIFASRLGRRAEFVALRNLYQTRHPILHIHETSNGLRPEWEHNP